MLEINKVYLGDCLDLMRDIPDKSIDCVITDPPYPDMFASEYNYFDGIIDFLNDIHCRQFVFWTAKCEFPLDYSAIHIWDKKCGVGSMYEKIFERNGSKNYSVFRHYLINSIVSASYTGDTFENHPSQKPVALIKELINKHTKPDDLILDPFMGSGTTCVACKLTGRRYIGIEKNEHYIKIARDSINDTIPNKRLFKE